MCKKKKKKKFYVGTSKRKKADGSGSTKGDVQTVFKTRRVHG